MTSTVGLPPGTTRFLVRATDQTGLTTAANVSIRVFPAGVPQFLGLGQAPSGGYSTEGNEIVSISGAYLSGTAVVNATYGRADLGLWFFTPVRVSSFGCVLLTRAFTLPAVVAFRTARC
jgi:hypothetical protein